MVFILVIFMASLYGFSTGFVKGFLEEKGELGPGGLVTHWIGKPIYDMTIFLHIRSEIYEQWGARRPGAENIFRFPST